MSSTNTKRWYQVIQNGIPQFVVSRFMNWKGTEFQTGDSFTVTDPYWLQMLYEQNRIAVADEPVTKKKQKRTRA